MRSIQDAMLASLSAQMVERSLLTEASDVKTTFSSWDNCMAKSYCKYPVIAAIVIASLILLSVITCIVRCACCGVSCCCSCFACLKCCGECCGACDNPRDRKHKHRDDDYLKPPVPMNNGYQAPMPMMSGGVTPGAGAPPQYAQFEVGPTGHAIAPKVVSEDALPPMPSWDTASKRRVSLPGEKDVEMEDLNKETSQKAPLMGRAGGMGMGSPAISPGGGNWYNDQPVQPRDYMSAGAAGGAMAAGGLNRIHTQDPYNRGPGSALGYRGLGTPSQYNSPSQGPGENPYDSFHSQQSQMTSPQPIYGRPGPGTRQFSNSAPGQNGMGMRNLSGNYPLSGNRQFSNNSPGPNEMGMRRPSNGPPQGPAQRQFSADRGMPGVARGPSPPSEIMEMPSPDEHRVASPLQNNSGFDFASAPSPAPYPQNDPRQQRNGNRDPEAYTAYAGDYRRPQPQQGQGQRQAEFQQPQQRPIAHQRDQSQAYELSGGVAPQQHGYPPQQRSQGYNAGYTSYQNGRGNNSASRTPQGQFYDY